MKKSVFYTLCFKVVRYLYFRDRRSRVSPFNPVEDAMRSLGKPNEDAQLMPTPYKTHLAEDAISGDQNEKDESIPR